MTEIFNPGCTYPSCDCTVAGCAAGVKVPEIRDDPVKGRDTMNTPHDTGVLEGLLERVKAATGPDRELDAAIERVAGEKPRELRAGPAMRPMCPPFSASIDASLSLVERVLPGWVVADLSQESRHAGDPWGCHLACYFGSAPSKNESAASGHDFPSAPLAILAATLSALISKATP